MSKPTPEPRIPPIFMLGLYGRSLYGALLLVVFIGLALPAVIGSYLLAGVQERAAATAALDEALQRNADILALGMQEPLWSLNAEAARPLLDAMMRDQSVVAIAVRDQQGATLVESHARERRLGQVRSTERPIAIGGERIGSLLLAMDDRRSSEELAAKQRSYALVLALQVAVSLLMIALLVRRRLLQPLRALMRFSDRLARGDFETPLKLDARDELGSLGEQMERMRLAIRDLFADIGHREKQFRTIVTQVPGAVYRARAGGAVEFVSDAIEGITGHPSVRFIGATTDDWAGIVHPQDRRAYHRQVREAVLSGSAYQIEYRIVAQGGVERWVQEHGQPQGSREDGFRVDGIIADISERKLAEERLRLSATVLEHIADGVMVLDPQGLIVTVNPAFTRITGYTELEAIGRESSLTRGGRKGEAFQQALWRALDDIGFWRGEQWDTRKDGEAYLEALTVSAMRDADGAISHYVCVFSDITQARASQDQLDHLAHHDPLTALPNRLLYHDRLLSAMVRAARSGTQLAVLFIDLDRFKNVNDTLGHHVGDELLKQAASALVGCLREGDTLARLGGDEFIVLIEDIDGAAEAARVAEQLVAMFEQPFMVSDYELFVTGSVGISLYPQDASDLHMLIRNADIAMYQAKARGRNGYQFYAPSMSGEGVERLRLEALLRRSIEKDEIFLVYQPQVEIDNGRLIGVEALVRWRHPELGLVTPDRFIALAEDTGFIGQLGQFVLAEACRQMVLWEEAGLTVPKMAVNLSVRQFERGGMAASVTAVLANTGLAPQRLQLEVTESVIMNTGDALQYVNDLHAIGVGLAIDDFGTGYSSLAYLKQMPVQTLKIDRSFIKDIPQDPDDEAIAIAIIQLGKSMNLSVIAEGVEREDQAAFLLRQGCNRAQGYLYGKPIAASEILAQWRGRTGG